MDKNQQKLNNNLKNLSSEIKTAYKDISENINDSYLIGKKDAYEEIMIWLKEHHHPELKYIAPFPLIGIAQEKLSKANSSLKIKDKEKEDSDINFSKFRMANNKKRVNKYAQRERERELFSDDEDNNSQSEETYNNLQKNEHNGNVINNNNYYYQNMNNNTLINNTNLFNFQSKKKKFQ